MNSEYTMFWVTYGSKLYGTSTPTSDTDGKAVYLPKLQDLLLGKKLSIYKERFDAEGNKVGCNDTMPDNGEETEFFPVQTFVRDFVQGQTYALEVAFAYLSFGPPPHGITYTSERPTYDFVKTLVDRFSNAEVYSMVGFAMKQTFDYVRRGERLNVAKNVLDVVDKAISLVPADSRLDTMLNPVERVIDWVARNAQLEIERMENGRKPLDSLKMNGRNYLESTTLEHLRVQIVKVVKQFGDRSNAAAETDVDYKSLSHAIRVYQQSIELLETGTITFPRPNAEFLLSVKQGKEDMESVKALLISLDDEVQQKIATSTMRKKTPELVAEAEQWLEEQLMELYNIGERE